MRDADRRLGVSRLKKVHPRRIYNFYEDGSFSNTIREYAASSALLRFLVDHRLERRRGPEFAIPLGQSRIQYEAFSLIRGHRKSPIGV